MLRLQAKQQIPNTTPSHFLAILPNIQPVNPVPLGTMQKRGPVAAVEMAKPVRALTSLAGNLSLVASTHVR